ncbi:MAG: oligosaccharide flippase family protein [Fimbriimonadales bacterium]
MSANQPSLRTQAVRGSIYLTLRQGFSVVLGLIGLLFMTRIVGPEGYGVYAAAFGIFKYLMLLSDSGVKMYLLRTRSDTPIEVFHQALCWLLFASLGCTLIAGVSLGSLLLLHASDSLLLITLLALCLNFPFAMVMNVPLTLLERNLDYRAIALTEIASQLLYYGVGIALALQGSGVWAFVGAFWAGQLVLFGGAFGLSRYRPRWLWNTALVRVLLRESFALAFAAFVYELRLLLPSVVLLPLGGAQAVGHYAIAQRLLTTLGFIRDAIARLSVPLYARVQDDAPKLLALARQSAQAQMVGYFALSFPFILTGDWVLKTVFGGKWDTGLILIAFAILAFNQLFFIIFGALNQILIVRKLSKLFLWSGALYVLFSIVLGYIVLPLTPEGQRVIAFSLVISVAYAPSYYLIMHLGTRRYLGATDYGINLLWAGALGIALLTPLLGYYALLGLVVLLLPQSRRSLREMVALVAEARHAKRAGTSQGAG